MSQHVLPHLLSPAVLHPSVAPLLYLYQACCCLPPLILFIIRSSQTTPQQRPSATRRWRLEPTLTDPTGVCVTAATEVVTVKRTFQWVMSNILYWDFLKTVAFFYSNFVIKMFLLICTHTTSDKYTHIFAEYSYFRDNA